MRGSSIYRVKSADAEGTTLGHRSWLYVTKRGKDGRLAAGGVTGPKVSDEIELRLDPKGGLLAGSGSSPLPLLGDLSMLIIEPFPDEPVAKWEDARTIALTKVEPVPGQSGRRGEPGQARPRRARPWRVPIEARYPAPGRVRPPVEARRPIEALTAPAAGARPPSSGVAPLAEASEETRYIRSARPGTTGRRSRRRTRWSRPRRSASSPDSR